MWFLLGIVIGGGAVWFWLARKSDERVSEIEKDAGKRIQLAQDDALQADSAHQETKNRLIELQFEYTKLEERVAELEDEIATLHAAAMAKATPAADVATVNDSPAPPPAGPGVAAAPPSVRQQRVKAINAKLAQLPAGSSARAKLLQERKELLDHVDGRPRTTNMSSTAREEDLKLIKGIGEVLERRLNELGIRTLRQVAEMDAAEVERVGSALDFRGRIERERWIEQARELIGTPS